MNRGADIWNSSVRSFPLVRVCRTLSGSWNGRPFRKRALISEKIAVFSPIPSANVITAIDVNAGDLRSWRRANFRSFISLGAQCMDRINARGATRGEQTGEKPSRAEDCECRAEQKRIVSRDLIKLGCKQSRQRKRSRQSGDQANDHWLHPLRHDQPQYIRGLSAKRHAHANFSSALLDRVSHCAVNPDAG